MEKVFSIVRTFVRQESRIGDEAKLVAYYVGNRRKPRPSKILNVEEPQTNRALKGAVAPRASKARAPIQTTHVKNVLILEHDQESCET